MEKIKIKTPQGYLSAAVHRPPEVSDKLAVLCPGFLDSKDYAHLVALAEMLCERGYTAVRFDPTGTWESSGNSADYDTTQYLEDVKTVIDHMYTESEYAHILLGGHSRGGRIAILYGARDPRISLALGIMPSHGYPGGPGREQWEKTGIKISQRDLPANDKEYREFQLPFSHVLDLDKYDTLSEAGKIKVPVILIAGELDELIPPEDVKILFDSIKGVKKMVIVPSIGHDYRRNEKEIKIVNDSIAKELDSLKL